MRLQMIQFSPFKRKHFLIILLATMVILQSSISAPALKTMGVGTEAPKFVLKNLEGEVQDFSSLKAEKLTVLLFWASWSRQSEKALKQMEKLHTKYKDMGLAVIGINVEKQTIDVKALTAVKSVIDRLHLSFPIMIDHGLVAFHDYGVIAVPTTVILDPKRKIMFEMSGFPLVASRDMTHFLSASIEDKISPVDVAAASGYQPDKKAVRFWNMGRKALQSRRTLKSAEKWFNKAIITDPKFTLPYISLGNFYQEQGRVKEARKQFEHALVQQPDNVKALSQMGLLLLEEGSMDAARTLLEKAIQADASYTPSYYYLGYLAGITGDTQKATELFTSATEINPLDYQINKYQGMMFEEQKKPKQAAACYKNVLQQLLNLQ